MQGIPDNIHFIGIGGAGMSGLAHILLKLGKRVSGSDLKRGPVVKRLESGGAECFEGHRAENIKSPGLVVVSTAIPANNPELQEAEKRKIPVIHRGDLLALLMERQKGVAVCGAHGKTTTTSMLAAVLEKNDFDPTVIIGGELPDIGGNAKFGRGEYLVAEADESDGSFLKLSPHMVVVTNVEDDHLDYYGDMAGMETAFRRFFNSIPESGLAVTCVDDPVVCRIIEGFDKPLVTYGINNKDADYTIEDISLHGAGTSGDIYFRGEFLGRLRLSRPGRHNLSNALAVIAVGCRLGLPVDRASKVLQEFNGAGRRFQLLGEAGGIKVVDDYAHHPSEIKVTLQAARQVAPERIIAVFQPHRYTRTSQLYERFGQVFGDADEVIINEIYSAGEAPIEGVDAGLIVDALKRNGQENVKYFAAQEEIVDYLSASARPGDLVLTMGAGNIWSAGVELVKRLKGNQA